MLKTKLQNFEGPLDLLLSLIEQRQLDITQISLAEVTEQFLLYLKNLKTVDPTILADYLSIAAKLLVIKSRAILPTLEVEMEEDDPGQDLESRLILYKQYKEVSKFLKTLDSKRKQSWTRILTFEQRINFFPDPNITTLTLHNSILLVLKDLRELDNLPKTKIKEAMSIQEKIQTIQNILSQQVQTKLSDLLKSAKNKNEAIITFLALLELIKQRIFVADQESLFTEAIITKYAEN